MVVGCLSTATFSQHFPAMEIPGSAPLVGESQCLLPQIATGWLSLQPLNSSVFDSIEKLPLNIPLILIAKGQLKAIIYL